MSREDSEMTFSVIVPCYNEEAVIAETHKRLTEVMGRLGETYEIIYVNDGSSDGTAAILRELSERDPHAKVLMFAELNNLIDPEFDPPIIDQGEPQ